MIRTKKREPMCDCYWQGAWINLNGLQEAQSSSWLIAWGAWIVKGCIQHAQWA